MDQLISLTKEVPAESFDGEKLRTDLIAQHGLIDLSRIPPKVTISDARDREALRLEISGILQNDSKGVPIGRVVNLSGSSYKGVGKLHTTIVTKVKPGKGSKCRLCIRGDQQSLANAAFTSAPTASMEYLRILVSLFCNEPQFAFIMADISRAFTQADYFNVEDRIIALMPKCVSMLSDSWKGELYLDSSCLNIEHADGSLKKLSTSMPNTHGVLLYKPLYGTRDAPMRWYCKIAAELNRFNFYATRTDCCIFCRYRPLRTGESGYFPETANTISSTIMLHVDDIIFVGLPLDMKDIKQCLAQFDHVPWEVSDESTILTFCGIQIDHRPGRVLELSHRPFYSKIAVPQKSELIVDSKVGVAASRLQKTLRGFIGSVLWLTQTRFDIAFEVCSRSSSLPDALRSIDSLRLFISSAVKLYSRIVDAHVPVTFVPLFSNIPPHRFAQLFSFSDASFGTLRASGSVESNIILLGVPIRRDGVVDCRGHLISWHCRRLNRVCRSTAQAEGLSLSNAGELTLYTQILLTELLCGEYQIDFLRQSSPLPLMAPFKVSPSPGNILAELKAQDSHESPSTLHLSVHTMTSNSFFHFAVCELLWNIVVAVDFCIGCLSLDFGSSGCP